MENWKSKYFENNKKESHVYIFTSLEIKKYLEKFFKNYGLELHDYRINFLDSNIDLYISYYQTLKSLEFIQKINSEQKIVVKKKKFNKKLSNLNNNNSLVLKQQIKNYHISTNNFIAKKVSKVFNLLKVLKTEYYSLKSLKLTNPLLLKKQKKILIQKCLKVFKYRKYLFFLLYKKKDTTLQKRIQLLSYYKTYLNISRHKNIKTLKYHNFLEKLTEGLSLYTQNQFNIFLTLKQTNRNIKFPKKQSLNLKRILSKLRRYQRNNFFNEGVNTLFTAVSEHNSAKLITDFIAFQLKFVKRHKFFLTFITKTLTLLINQKFSKIKGIKLKVKGRINNSARSKSNTIKIGKKTSLITVNSQINHAQSTSYGSNGTFGVKAWVFYN